MKIIDNLFRRKEPKEPWPLRFDSYSFDARCHNTLRCSIIFDRTQFALTRELNGPSGEPHRPDWKEHWNAGFGSTEEFETRGFPSPVDIKWTALDGIERETEIDLETVFPGHEILHNVPRESVDEYWATHMKHHAWIYLEINDRTINIYIEARVPTNIIEDPIECPDKIISHYDMLLAWTKTY
ncbi:hypothetical protein EBB59_11500 [Lysobacter pythonis]|uniref:Uncharacterized protein n=1 Tax=Solilutibacter pythonis TaxID=2483112 RepID=A0A3M2HJQ0_9GAMM|nr:hypothetical protein [Lysobacter pythonis]RMH88595.1 hypothetical protein EBB59_11500 [Lysobacter pythonis]